MSLVAAFPGDEAPATRLAEALGAPCAPVGLHRFPDGESLPEVPLGPDGIVVYRSLDRPDDKLMPLLLAADAWRRAGVARLTLVAPYMPYLRQDAVFRPGQPLSRDVIGRLLGQAFDRIVTVDPHLHRTGPLDEAFGTAVQALTAGPLLAAAFAGAPGLMVVGPDGESRQWVEPVARALGARRLEFRKARHGDHAVTLSADPGELGGRPVLLVDDICSSGGTLEAALGLLAGAGAGPVDIAVTHALFDEATGARLRAAGARRIVSTDSCLHPTNAVRLAPLLAAALKDVP